MRRLYSRKAAPLQPSRPMRTPLSLRSMGALWSRSDSAAEHGWFSRDPLRSPPPSLTRPCPSALLDKRPFAVSLLLLLSNLSGRTPLQAYPVLCGVAEASSNNLGISRHLDRGGGCATSRQSWGWRACMAKVVGSARRPSCDATPTHCLQCSASGHPQPRLLRRSSEISAPIRGRRRRSR